MSPDNIEACHPFKSNDKNKIIVKFAKRKDCQAVLNNKKNIKSIPKEDLGSSGSKVFINESLCKYYKLLWSLCKSLWNDKLIFAFWTVNGSLRLKFRQEGRVHMIFHKEELKELFPEYDFEITEKN